MIGEVKSFSSKNGYGFITADGRDYRFRAQHWGLRIPPCVGMNVEFDTYETIKGFRATNIRSLER